MKKPRASAGLSSQPPGASSPSFLLAQLGAYAASKFAERLRSLKLAPPHAGILGILSANPAITQQRLAATLGMVPSRLVALLDELETRGLIERRANLEDRRRHALHLTEKGRSALDMVGRVSREHSHFLLAALSEDDQRQLAAFLQRAADAHGLTRGVHPGYGLIGGRPTRSTNSSGQDESTVADRPTRRSRQRQPI
ncbi:MAG TPA: MarR family winged helix-turn-helix transcriptional regulator [Terriglobia bacterium]|nr:MarR family winged helix-turn-helix transcriptional regulator [Terriglobia bacterium]